MSMNKRPPLRRSAPVETENDGVIEGRNAVIEALRAGVAIDKIFLMKGETDSALGHIASAAREKGIVVVDADRRKLDGMSRTHSHQGVIAVAAAREYASVDDILNIAREKGEAPLIVVCDELSDPHNLGAVIRTADAAGPTGSSSPSAAPPDSPPWWPRPPPEPWPMCPWPGCPTSPPCSSSSRTRVCGSSAPPPRATPACTRPT